LALGQDDPWAPPPDATPEQIAEHEAFMARLLVPDESITAWVELDDDALTRKWDALHEHVTQIAADSWFLQFGLEGWREVWRREAYILRESRVPVEGVESDLFAGIG
jgi:hypothetical protein